jgi:hypothetical protein
LYLEPKNFLQLLQPLTQPIESFLIPAAVQPAADLVRDNQSGFAQQLQVVGDGRLRKPEFGF